MKKVFIALMILAASAAFANTPSDSGVTVEGWRSWGEVNSIPVSDLADNNGFTANTINMHNPLGDDYVTEVGFQAEASGWLFDPNESVTITVIEDFSDEQISSFDGNFYISLQGIPLGYETGPFYMTLYTGPGDYTLELVNDFGLEEGSELSDVYFGIADFDNDAGYYNSLMIPAGKTLTVRFGSEQPETVVPEPATCAYALMGLGSLLGIKRKIRK